MTESLSAQLLTQISAAQELYHRLILIAAPNGSGKTAVLQNVAQHTGLPVLNLNLELSGRLLDLTERQRVLQLPRLVDEIVRARGSPVLLDNIEILFDVTLKQDPLRVLQGVSRNRTVVAAWNGTLENRYLSYATPEHPEYRRYSSRDLMVVCPENTAR